MTNFSIRLCAAFVFAALFSAPCLAAVVQPDVVYLNRCTGGCMVLSGSDDAITGHSSLVSGTKFAAAFPGTDAVFDQTAACVRHVFLPFNIHVVASSPGNAPRREIMLTTTASTIGLNNGPFSVAPFDGSPHDDVIGFVFATTIGPTAVNALCQNTAQTVAFLYGMEFVVGNCADIEDSATGCGEKSFTNVDSTCDGLFSGNPGHCVSGSTTQNSYAKLLSAAAATDFILANSFEGFEVTHAGPSP